MEKKNQGMGKSQNRQICILSKENIASLLVKEFALYHNWFKFWRQQALFGVFFSAIKAIDPVYQSSESSESHLNLPWYFLETLLIYSEQDEGQVAEVASLIPEHSKCSGDPKVPEPVSRWFSDPAKGTWKWRCPGLTGRSELGSQNHHQEKHYWKHCLCFIEIKYTPVKLILKIS